MQPSFRLAWIRTNPKRIYKLFNKEIISLNLTYIDLEENYQFKQENVHTVRNTILIQFSSNLLILELQVYTCIQIRVFWVGAARTRAPAATNYDVHAPRREMLGSSDPKCNGWNFPRPSAILTTDWPCPGKYRALQWWGYLYPTFLISVG